MKFCDIIIWAGCLGIAGPAAALSLGPSQGAAILGEPLNLSFQMQPDAGQTAESSCVMADVFLGDVRLTSSQVQVSTQRNQIRLRTTAPVNEPLITVKLTAGCAGAVSRSYTLFADPPLTLAATQQPINLQPVQVRPLPAARPQTTSASSSASGIVRPARTRSSKRLINPAAARMAAANAVPLVEVPNESAPPSLTETPAPATEAAAPEPLLEQPRLRMEPLVDLGQSPNALPTDPTQSIDNSSLTDSGTELLLQTALASQAATLQAENSERLARMEEQMLAMQTQLSQRHSEIANLQAQLQQAQNQGLPLWIYLMMAALALAIASIGWLLQRLKQQRELEQAWSETVIAAADDLQIMPRVPEDNPLEDHWSMLPQEDRQASTQPVVTPAPSSTPPSTVSAAAGAQAASPNIGTQNKHHAQDLAQILTAQALFDVQEQAEFFASVGEYDQAIALLQAHIEEHQKSSPLAYLELLQLLYRLSRTETFEQVREEFQTHFNVNVPNFLSFARKGRELWTSYPEVLSRVEAVWPTDDVVPLLQELIVRSSETDPRFDLAAFDDLLMLLNVAQTTPAASRGKMIGRERTAAQEVPLPDIQEDLARSALPEASHFIDDLLHPATPAPVPAPHITPEQAPPMAPAAELSLNLDLSALSLESLSTGTSEAPASSQSAPAPAAETAPSVLQDLALDLTLADTDEQQLQELLSLDERDLPPPSARQP